MTTKITSAIMTLIPLALALPAMAQTTSAEPERKICRKEDVVGSRLPKRTCLTQPEWDAKAQAATINNGSGLNTMPMRSYSKIPQRQR
jgi:hypothetical protein